MKSETNQNIDIEEFENHIKKGLINGYKQNIYFTQNYSDLQSRVIEYLIVVNVAQALENYASRNYYHVNLEYSLNDFYNNAFPQSTFTGEIFSQEWKGRKNHSPADSKSRRLDIAITQDFSVEGEWFSTKKSLIGIEIKSINQPNKKIKKDIERLAIAQSLKDEIGKNNIACCFACFFKRFDSDNTTISKDEILKVTKSEKEYWEKHFKTLQSKFPTLAFELIDTNIVNLPAEDFNPIGPPEDYDYSDLLDNSGHINAYLVKISTNEK